MQPTDCNVRLVTECYLNSCCWDKGDFWHKCLQHQPIMAHAIIPFFTRANKSVQIPSHCQRSIFAGAKQSGFGGSIDIAIILHAYMQTIISYVFAQSIWAKWWNYLPVWQTFLESDVITKITVIHTAHKKAVEHSLECLLAIVVKDSVNSTCFVLSSASAFSNIITSSKLIWYLQSFTNTTQLLKHYNDGVNSSNWATSTNIKYFNSQQFCLLVNQKMDVQSQEQAAENLITELWQFTRWFPK